MSELPVVKETMISYGVVEGALTTFLDFTSRWEDFLINYSIDGA